MKLSADIIIERLNSMAEADSDAVMRLIETRVTCNDELAEHPTCQVGQDESGECTVGLLGILNGILGKDSKGWGYLCAELDDNGKLIRFKKTPQYNQEHNLGGNCTVQGAVYGCERLS